jgi:acetaldehyde dehydrogenase (acetylating)
VNTQAALGAVGYTNGLDPSLTLGPGTWGGSIISDNVTARHLMNVKRLAFETHPINPENPSDRKGSPPIEKPIQTSWLEEIDKRILMKAGNTPVWKKEEPTVRGAEKSFGTGLSSGEVDRIADSFAKRLK